MTIFSKTTFRNHSSNNIRSFTIIYASRWYYSDLSTFLPFATFPLSICPYKNKLASASKKKKKKKKTAAEKRAAATESKESNKPISAQAKAILERKNAAAAEAERIRLEEEAEEAKLRAEEEAAEAAKQKAEEMKEINRKKKEEKVAKQKAAGTYMTKAQKAKAKQQQARLEAMMAGGLVIGGKKDSTGDTTEEKESPKEKVVDISSMYDKRKKTNTPFNNSKTEVEENESTQDISAEGEKVVATTEIELDVMDDWDADDDWESALDGLADKIGDKADQYDFENTEDMTEIEQKKEQEKLKQLGLERAKRDEEARKQREAEEALAAEMERKEREALMKKENSRKRRMERDAKYLAARSPDNLRAPISVIMGHVDTGKTKLLDNIRQTNVQEGEAGGITQQIGATQFSTEVLRDKTKPMQNAKGGDLAIDIKLPGLLMIDTPGHESFSNLRSRGSSLCDIAILVVDLMHGLEPQTIESLKMLVKGNTPFVVALNKVDRCYGWKTNTNSPIRDTLEAQDSNTKDEFYSRADQAMLQLREQGINCELYWKNEDLKDTISLIPTSAHTGEGVPDLLSMVIKCTQDLQVEKLMYNETLQCTVLEVKVIEGLGPTCDVVLVNGTLKEGDTIVFSTMDGPVVTQIKALLTPPPNREMRIKSEYIHHKQLSGAIGIKIVAPEIGRAIAGTPLLVVESEDDVEDVKEDCHADIGSIMKALETDARGVTVHASTLGAMEALLHFLREECKPPIPVSHIAIGTIFKKDVMRANLMNEKEMPEFATILAFDVRVDNEASAMAEELNVRIMTADIIYHLFDQFSAFMEGILKQRKDAAFEVVQFPVILKILQQNIFNKKDPIVVGVEILEGHLRLGTTLCIPSLDDLVVGTVENIQNNHKDVTKAQKGQSVAIKIVNEGNPTMMYGRQFDHTNSLYSKMSRKSIDALKEFFKE